MDLLISASFIAAFFAGVAALFAPCCITVLLPTYLASVFKHKATVFLMTFVFFLGLLTVFLPIGLGATSLAQFFSSYHNQIFILGAFLLIALGLTLVLGMKFSLPIPIHPQIARYDIGSIYVLGIFSGIATTCCAPVLAGVLVLAALPGSLILGGVYTLSYVIGMVAPLFLLAAFLDKSDFSKRVYGLRKTITYPLFDTKISVTLSNLVSGLMYLVLGGIIFYLTQTNNLLSHSSLQLSVNVYIAKLTQTVGRVTSFLPEWVWALIFLGLFALIVKVGFGEFKKLKEKDI